MKLINVRLGPEDASMAESLRRGGVELSQIVREAIRARYLQVRSEIDPGEVDRILEGIYADHPEPPRHKEDRVDVRDRRAFQVAVRRKLRPRKR